MSTVIVMLPCRIRFCRNTSHPAAPVHIEERDALSAASAFAKRTLSIYRKAVLNPKHFASTPYYRRSFIESYLLLKRYALSKIREHPLRRAMTESA